MITEDSIFLLKDVGSISISIREIALRKGYTNPNQIVVRTGLHHRVVNRYWTGEITKPDKQILAIFCFLFKCDVNDIIKYNPPKNL